MRVLKIFFLTLLPILMVGCSPATPQGSGPDPGAGTGTETPATVSIKLVEAYPGLSFDQPLDYRHAGDDIDRVFVVEKTGRILVFQNDPQVQAARVFLDLTGLVDSRASEKGLLGLAFHPDYKHNRYFYVNYTDSSGTVIARYQTDPADPNRGLPDSAKVLLAFPQPYSNHNGGNLAFGPDGYLYIATGDGGSQGDPQKNAQNRGSLLGKILRIDVDKPGADKPYSIPGDNPFFGNTQGFREEVYAYGLRNPWRFSFDRERGWLWAADVGQNKIEEIDIIQKGANYGWNLMEGSQRYSASADFDKTGLTLPVWEYEHSLGNSVTGGYVYYGSKTPSLKGAYIYGDFGSGMIWALRLGTDLKPDNRLLIDSKLNISSFGVDQNNELYIVDYSGKIYRLLE
ncbi:MAG: glucose sorbosone dehydrogenase [Firmicutes bacterium]|nr:glucose sorbosone dehydrogenase [Bacillota bacterium]